MKVVTEHPGKINPVIEELISDLKLLLGSDLEKIILYGSYARGKYEKHSDVDLLILTKKTPAKYIEDKLTEITSDYLVEKGVLFSIIIKSSAYFFEWENVMDLFINVNRDGTIVYG